MLDRHGVPVRGLNAVQIEVCREIYLDKALHKAGDGLGETVQIIASLVRRLADELANGGLGHHTDLPQAAE